jgi:hypothetical protein
MTFAFNHDDGQSRVRTRSCDTMTRDARKFTPDERRNWGFIRPSIVMLDADGVAHAQRGRAAVSSSNSNNDRDSAPMA